MSPKKFRRSVQGDGRTRTDSALSEVGGSAGADLYFSSQAAADAYVLHHRITKLYSSRRTRARAQQLSRFQLSLAALDAPFYKLSDEVIEEIFLFGAAGDESTRFAKTVSCVATRWRRIALTTPRLWTSITASFSDGRILHQLDRLKRALSRTGTSSLSLQIPMDLHYSNTISDFERRVVPLITAIIPRCATLGLSFDQPTPYMRHVFVPTGFFSVGSPMRLRHLSLSHVYIRDGQGFLNCLQTCPALEDISWWDASIFVPYGSQERVTLVSLRKLVISGPTGGLPRMFIANIAAPSLETLQLSHCSGSITELLRACSSTVSGVNSTVFPSLKHFTFADCRDWNFHFNVLATFLFSLPHLERLSLKDICFFHSIIAPDVELTHVPCTTLGWRTTGTDVEIERCKHFVHFLDYLRQCTPGDHSQFRLGVVRVHSFSPSLDTIRARLESWASSVEWGGLPSINDVVPD